MHGKKIAASLTALAVLSGLAGCSSTTQETQATSVADTTVAATSESSSEVTSEETAEETSEDTTALDSVDYLAGYETFEVTSNDLVDGVWADVISPNEGGENVSPDLSWEPVDGAECYVVYMVDVNAWNWIHWKSDMITDTELPEGYAASMEYMGPYPPSGSTHTYDVYVVALRAPVDRVKGSIDSQNPNFEQFITGLDEDADGNSGNIIAYGRLSGTYTA